MTSKQDLFVSIVLGVICLCNTNNFEIKPNILTPPLPHKPFVVVWNVASENCEEKFDVSLDLSDFDIVYNANKGWRGDEMTIFYANQLGLYPHIGKDGRILHGGIPQLGNINAHLTKAKEDIVNFIPDPDFRGLAVIDWEPWVPLWSRMGYGNRLAYRNMSIENVRMEHPDWPYDKIVEKAKSEYEAAAREFISFTLSLAKIIRPKAKWGLYLYPDCYNYNKSGHKHTFKCSNSTVRYNDQIEWAFEGSTGLYPSVYLGEWDAERRDSLYFVAYRVLEAVRVDTNRKSTVSVPIYSYHLITYRREYKFLDLTSLRDSIGVASVLGASGAVIWGDHNLANSIESCTKLSNYVTHVLGPYVKALSVSATKCSQDNCNGNGRCVFTNYPTGNAEAKLKYLSADGALKIVKHFNESMYKIFDEKLGQQVLPMSYSISCQCYSKWKGNMCNEPR